MKTPCVFPGCSKITKLFTSKSTEFELEALEVHNEFRSEHGVPPLVLNKEITKFSQKWAEELAKKDEMAYSLHQKYGESVYCGWSSDPQTKIKARDCIEKWYSEINNFSFGKEPEVLTCGHFTQIVWKDTRELGVGSAKSKSGKLYVVANYYPPGNYIGQFLKNVFPPGANQFRSHNNNSPRKSFNRLAPPSPTQRNNKNLGDIASDLVGKFRTSTISAYGEKFEEECLKAHNEYRRKHGVQPLEINKKLCKLGEDWAKTLAKKGRSEHKDQNEYGENIYSAWSTNPNFTVSGRDPVDEWYSEVQYHKFGKEPSDIRSIQKSGHFTQLVWEDTKELGVGVGKSKDGHIYVVAYYNPPGNVIGSFAKKVKPPIN